MQTDPKKTLKKVGLIDRNHPTLKHREIVMIDSHISDNQQIITPMPLRTETPKLGQKFLKRLSEITGANMAASATPTGNAKLGGNWELEVTLGEMVSPIAIIHHQQLTYQGVLGAGDLDTTFNGTGKVTTDFFGGNDYGNAMTIDSSGRILVAGSSNGDFALTRYNSDGSLDTTFGTGGKVTTAIGSRFDYGNAMSIDSSGKILVAGYASNGSNYDFALTRYNSDGSLDITFDTDGKVTTDFGSGDDFGNAMTLDSSGKILVAGYAGGSSKYDFALTRYNSDGSLDSTFGTGGKVTTDIGSSSDFGNAMSIDSSGKILVAGYASNGSNSDIALTRYNTNGSLDTTFGAGGKVTTNFFGSSDYGNAITLDSSGKILVAGSAYNVNSYDIALTRYNSDGSLDSTFGTGGKVTTDIASNENQGNAITLDSSGKILVAGSSYTVDNNSDFALTRYNSDGSLDTTFGTGGIVTTAFFGGIIIGNGIIDEGNAMTLDSSGKILVAGNTDNDPNSNFALARYGTPDVAVTTPAPSSVTVKPNDINQLLYHIDLNVTGWDTTLTGLSMVTGGTYTPTDISDFKLWYSNDSIFDPGDTLISSNAPLTPGSTITFGPLNQTITKNTTGSLFLSTDISATATDGKIIKFIPLNLSLNSLTFDSATKTGTLMYGRYLTIDSLAPSVALSSTSAATVNAPFSVTATFSEDVSNFVIGDIMVGNGTVGNFVAVDPQTYTFDVTPTDDGNVTIDIPASVATDLVDKNNIAAMQLTRTYDTTAPSVVLSASGGTGNAPLSVRANFSEDVKDFVISDVIVGNGTVGNFVAVDPKNYTFDITPMADGNVTVDIPSAVATDLAGNNNTAATQISRNYDTTAPSVVLTSTSSATVNAPFSVTATFSEGVKDFLMGDIIVGNGTVGNFTPVTKSFTFDITPTADGNVTVDIPGAVATDLVGNNNTAATQLTRTYDGTIPSVALTSTSPATVNVPFMVTATFSEDVSNFAVSDIIVGNGNVANFVAIDPKTYTFDITPTGANVTVDIPSAVATDLTGNNNTAATQLTRTYDGIAPTVALSSTSSTTVNAPFSVKATFSEDVSNFVIGDIIVGNGTVGNFVAVDPKTYTFDVTPTGANVTVDIPSAVATDVVGNNNSAATQLTRTYDGTMPTANLTPVSEITTSGATNQTFTVTYSDNIGIYVSSIDDNDIKINGNIAVTKISIDTNSNGTPRVVTYGFTPPGGSWDETDNGTYTVNLQGDQIQDTNGNIIIAGILGNIVVNIPTPVVAPTPTPVITPTPTPVVAPTPTPVEPIPIIPPVPILVIEKPVISAPTPVIASGETVVIPSFAADILPPENAIKPTPDQTMLVGVNDYSESLNGDERSNVIYSYGGNDSLWGNGGNDFLYGHEGDDLILGGMGKDYLNGSVGNDSLDGGINNDLIYGIDNDDLMQGDGGDDLLEGGAGNDSLNGGDDNDRLIGNNGLDLMFGGSGDDNLLGGKDNDTLIGGRGNDTLIGGDGHDLFILGSGENSDIILDFELGKDLIIFAKNFPFSELEIKPNSQGVVLQKGADNLAIIRGINPSELTPINFMLADYKT